MQQRMKREVLEPLDHRENEDFNVGEIAYYSEFPLKAVVEILEKEMYLEPAGDEWLRLTLRCLEVIPEYPEPSHKSKPPAIGEEFEIKLNLSVTLVCSGMPRILPLEYLRRYQAELEVIKTFCEQAKPDPDQQNR